MKIKTEYDPEIMAQLLSEPGVIEHVAQMTPKEQDFFKELLVSQGTYKRYVAEQQKKQVKEMIGDAFPKIRKAARKADEALRGIPDETLKRPAKLEEKHRRNNGSL